MLVLWEITLLLGEITLVLGEITLVLGEITLVLMEITLVLEEETVRSMKFLLESCANVPDYHREPLNVEQFIMTANAMGSIEPPYFQGRFKELQNEVSGFTTKVGFNPAAVASVPISGWRDDNMIETSANLTWYKGWIVEKKEGEVNGTTYDTSQDSGQHRPPRSKPTDK